MRLAARLQPGVLAAGVLELALGGLELLPGRVLGSLYLLTCRLVELDGVGVQALGQIDAELRLPGRLRQRLSCSWATASARSVVMGRAAWLLASLRAACSAASASASAVGQRLQVVGQAPAR